MVNVSSLCLSAPLSEAVLPDLFCAYQLPTITLNAARSIRAIGTGDLLVLEKGRKAVVYLEDVDGDDIPDVKRDVVAGNGLNHGIALFDDFLYASSPSTVYRWPLLDNFTVASSTPTVVMTNMPTFYHSTRTLAFDSLGRLYVAIGSGSNIDADSSRARIMRYNITDTSVFPIDFVKGELFADGTRNEVAIAFDRHGVLWGAENGLDFQRRIDLGGFITEDNPAEELNRFPEANKGKHYGYPYCWTEYNVPRFGKGRGTVWAQGEFMRKVTSPGIVVTDQDCRTKYVPPEVAMQAHSAPLGMTFYNYKAPDQLPTGCTGTFPQSMDGYAFIGFHGSWNRIVPTGYKVVYVPMSSSGNATGQPVDLLAHAGNRAKWPNGFRPVDVSFDTCGRLVVSSDGSSAEKVIRIEYGYTKAASCQSLFAPCEQASDCCTGTSCGLFGRCTPSWVGGW